MHAEDPPGKEDYDWVKRCATDDGKWIFWNTKRLHLMRDLLTRGIPVQYRSSGTSLAPLVKSDDICYIYPIKYGDEIEVGDIVFCSVQSGDRLYVHLVWDKYYQADYYGVDQIVYIIGNNKSGAASHCNGWCYRYHIYGKLTKAESKSSII